MVLLAAIAVCSCVRAEKESEFWLGADIGWCTEYEANGHKFYNIVDKAIIDTFYNAMGIAWFFGIDTENERVFLPRNKYLF